jgi:hypothetical protein
MKIFIHVFVLIIIILASHSVAFAATCDFTCARSLWSGCDTKFADTYSVGHTPTNDPLSAAAAMVYAHDMDVFGYSWLIYKRHMNDYQGKLCYVVYGDRNDPMNIIKLDFWCDGDNPYPPPDLNNLGNPNLGNPCDVIVKCIICIIKKIFSDIHKSLIIVCVAARVL